MIKIVVRNCPHPGIFYYEPKTTTFEGELLPNPEWIANDCIAISGDSFTPIRIIRKRDILSGLEVEKIPVLATNQIYEVTGSKGDLYKVTFSADGNWYCTCKGFQYRSSCRHINETINKIQKEKPSGY